MTISGLYKLSEPELADKLTFISNVIVGNPTNYTLTAPIAAALQNAAEIYAQALVDQESAQAAFTTAVQAKSDFRADALNLITQYLNVIYAAPTVDDTAITALGLTPRATTRTTVTPQQPLALLAVPSPTGQCELSWNRNGNPFSVQFVIESRTNTTEWDIHSITSKSKVMLNGLVPGETTWFRVYAQKNNDFSVPSNVAVIYEGGELVALSVAA